MHLENLPKNTRQEILIKQCIYGYKQLEVENSQSILTFMICIASEKE